MSSFQNRLAVHCRPLPPCVRSCVWERWRPRLGMTPLPLTAYKTRFCTWRAQETQNPANLCLSSQEAAVPNARTHPEPTRTPLLLGDESNSPSSVHRAPLSHPTSPHAPHYDADHWIHCTDEETEACRKVTKPRSQAGGRGGIQMCDLADSRAQFLTVGLWCPPETF